MIRAHRISDDSTFLGQTCALCKQGFDAGDLIVVCPEDGSRHHDHCWIANGNHCTAYGCTGEGEIGVGIGSTRRRPTSTASRPTIIPNPAAQSSTRNPSSARTGPAAPPGSKIRVMPARNFGCARSCLFLAAVLAILFLAAACFGIWTFADNVMREGISQLPAVRHLVEAQLTALPILGSLI